MHTHKKHLFFDMDDTVTMTRSPMDDDSLELFSTLPHDIIIVSGAHVNQIALQLRNLPVYRLGQNGNHAMSPDSSLLWEEVLKEHHTEKILSHIDALRKIFPGAVTNEEDLIEERGAQISYSLIGHHAELESKKRCDPDQAHRKNLLSQIPFDHDDVEVRIGGTTCLDYFEKGKNKGYNVKRLIQHMGWDPDDALYFGDALFPGGNDETVIGVIDTVQVRDHRHTYQILNEHFAQKNTEL